MKLGYFLSSEEFGPRELVRQAVLARDAGFRDLWISDHFHPWVEAQGHSSFVWSVIGAIAEAAPEMTVTTAVTCPTTRIHPAILAQATATASLLLEGRFRFGVGTGEALNEHILGDRWPEAADRREQLAEAITLIRELWQGGTVSHHGAHYTVEHARIYDAPTAPIDVIVSGFGPRAIDLAAELGDGFCTVQPDADAVARYRHAAASPGLVQGGTKVCWAADADTAVRTVHERWPNEALPGELAQILPTPAHFEQACSLITREMVAAEVPCGPSVEAHLNAVEAYAEAGFDELYIQQIGPDQAAFFEAYAEHVLPRYAPVGSAAG